MSGLILHEDPRSGNCYKIRLTAAHLQIPLERRSYDVMKGETRTPEYLANVSAYGRIPVLEDGDRSLSESNAICFFLGNGTSLVPDGHFDLADMLRWMFWEQYSHEPNIATLRFWLRFVGIDALSDAQRMQITGKRESGQQALDLMDRHLADRKWFVADQFSLADIYLAMLSRWTRKHAKPATAYANVKRCVELVKARPAYQRMLKAEGIEQP